MSTNVEQPVSATGTVGDAPYTSSLLRYDTQIKQTWTMLTTMRALISCVNADQCFQPNALVQTAELLHATASKELEHLLKCAELLIRYEYDKPGHISKNSVTREDVEQGLVALGRLINKLVPKDDELEAARVRLLQRWGFLTP